MKEGKVDGSDDSEDQSIDLNEVPVERKRKRVSDSGEKENVKLGVVSPEGSGRVLRSRTVALAEGEKQVDACEEVLVVKSGKRRGRPKKGDVECGVVSGGGGGEQWMSASEGVNEGGISEVSVSVKKGNSSGGAEGKCEQRVSVETFKTAEEGGDSEMSVSLNKGKKRRGRPPKGERKSEDVSEGEKQASLVSDGAVKMMDEDGSSDVSVMLKTEKRRGRPRKTDGEQLVSLSEGTVVKVDENGSIEGACEVSVTLKREGKCGVVTDGQQPVNVSVGTIQMEDKDGRDEGALKPLKEEKRRGRPRKSDADQPVRVSRGTNMMSDEDGSNEGKFDVSKGKRRGRPPKTDGEQPVSVSGGTSKIKDEDGRDEGARKPLKEEKRRGRPRKSDADQPVRVIRGTIMTSDEDGSSEGEFEVSKGKRRGRPPKTDGEQPVSVNGGTSKINDEDGRDEGARKPLKEEKRRGRPRKSDVDQPVRVIRGTIMTSDEDGSSEGEFEVTQGKRRGRPPKIDGEQPVSVSGGASKIKDVDGSTDGACEASKGKRRGRPPREGKSGVVTDGEQNQQITKAHGIKYVDRNESSEVPSASLQMNRVKKSSGRPQKVESKDGDERDISVRDRMKGDGRGRPRKVKGEGGVSCLAVAPVLMKRKKMNGKRGRPSIVKDKNGPSLLSSMKEDGKVIGGKKLGNGMKRGRGRPPKESAVTEPKLVTIKRLKIENYDEKSKNLRAGKRLEITGSSRNSIMAEKKSVERAGGKEIGLREQKQLIRDQIVAMLLKAGWKIEYRQRGSKDYQDAIYVDREGRGYWSVTLAYKKLKERIDKQEGTDKDIQAFSPIPDEKFSMLFRITTKGKKIAGKRKNADGVTIKKASKVKSAGGSTKSKSNRGKGTLRSRVPGDGSDKGGYVLYEGKLSLLSWMIDLGTVSLGEKVKYKRGRTKKMVLNGKITKDGICCDCCNTIHTIYDFESHAKSNLGEPFRNLYLESGSTLFQSLVDSWKKYAENAGIRFVHVDVDGDDPNDDTCNICGDGGNLICCDSCPSTFHHGCLDIKIPSGDWHCIYCSCKFCGMAGESTSITDDGHDLLSELSMCSMCEEKFHVNCKDAEDFDHEDPSFCGNECQKIFERLKVLDGVRHELEEGFFYTVLHHHEVGSEASLDGCLTVESNSKLAVAFKVMDECFEPITDERSGTNMIQNVLYNCGSNIRRLSYSGFYTVILEKGDELIAAASVRIHGSQLAEMPFIGTRYKSRRQGMCGRLLTAIEKVLSSLGVEKLVIPAVNELNETWTKVFGFYPLEESQRQEMKYMSLVVFPKTSMLQKPVSTKPITDCTAMECTEVGEEHHGMKENTESNSNPLDGEKQSHDEAAAVESNADLLPDGPAVESNANEHNQITQEGQNNGIQCLDSSSLCNVTSAVDIDENGKPDEVDAGDVESDTKTAENGSCLKKSNDNDTKIEVNTGIDCNVEPAEECEEEPKSRINSLLSVSSNGKCNDQDTSGGVGEEVKLKREEIVC